MKGAEPTLNRLRPFRYYLLEIVGKMRYHIEVNARRNTMDKFVVIDTETTWGDKVMSIGGGYS